MSKGSKREQERIALIAQKEEIARTIRKKAEDIRRPDLKSVQSKDIGKIEMLPMSRVRCTACGVPLYVGIGQNNKAIQIADSVPTSGSSGCKHVNGAASRRPETR